MWHVWVFQSFIVLLVIDLCLHTIFWCGHFSKMSVLAKTKMDKICKLKFVHKQKMLERLSKLSYRWVAVVSTAFRHVAWRQQDVSVSATSRGARSENPRAGGSCDVLSCMVCMYPSIDRPILLSYNPILLSTHQLYPCLSCSILSFPVLSHPVPLYPILPPCAFLTYLSTFLSLYIYLFLSISSIRSYLHLFFWI